MRIKAPLLSRRVDTFEQLVEPTDGRQSVLLIGRHIGPRQVTLTIYYDSEPFTGSDPV